MRSPGRLRPRLQPVRFDFLCSWLYDLCPAECALTCDTRRIAAVPILFCAAYSVSTGIIAQFTAESVASQGRRAFIKVARRRRRRKVTCRGGRAFFCLAMGAGPAS